jgi:hypothetical protein
MTSTTMTLVDGSTSLDLTVADFNRAIPGVVVRSYDLGFPSVREIVSDDSDQDGTQDFTTFFGSRVVKLECSIHDTPTQTRHELYEIVRTMCIPSHRPQLLVQCEGWAQQRVITMRGTPASCVVGSKHATFLEASLGWVVPTGVMLGLGSELAIQPLQTSATGRSYPKSYPWNYVPGSLSNTATATNSGNAPWGWVAKFYGQATNITITNSTTGDKMVLNYNIPNGHYVQFDSRAKTALLDNDPSNSVFGSIDFTKSSWWALGSGDNTVSVTAQSSDTSSICYFDFWSAWV